jgi:hypothetical protein
MEVNIGFQPRRDRVGIRSANAQSITNYTSKPAHLACFTSTSHSPTTIHTQITTNQPPNKGVVSFQLHFSEQLHNLKSAQQEGARSL